MDNSQPIFPISVSFEDGSVESFDDILDLETNLEMFDSDLSPKCIATDALGRRIRLRINNVLVLEELSLISDGL